MAEVHDLEEHLAATLRTILTAAGVEVGDEEISALLASKLDEDKRLPKPIADRYLGDVKVGVLRLAAEGYEFRSPQATQSENGWPDRYPEAPKEFLNFARSFSTFKHSYWVSYIGYIEAKALRKLRHRAGKPIDPVTFWYATAGPGALSSLLGDAVYFVEDLFFRGFSSESADLADREEEQRRVLSEAGVSFDVEAFLAGNPFLQG